jgi:hypothetical protein
LMRRFAAGDRLVSDLDNVLQPYDQKI